MFESIRFQAFLRVANERKVAGILRRFGQASNRAMTLHHCERYWKDRTLFDVQFSTPLGVEDIATAVFQTLCVCRTLLPEWSVRGPFSYANGAWEFQGQSMNVAEGLELVLFTIDNSTPSFDGLSEKQTL